MVLSITFSGQETSRLALVIGNADYPESELKNPVNDAQRVAQSLDSLGFEVLLSTNIPTKEIFISKINEFGTKRAQYDVAFVYYAGHGVQIGTENFLLPTQERFNSEFDVEDNGVSVQKILRYLKSIDNNVNIMILDACRNNPYENNWNTNRSLEVGMGLAKIPPPTGSLIAFSTEAGQTAPDGQGANSLYTTSLCKNMMLSDISIDQVFRNVRADVLVASDGQQRPIESSQLTGETFFLRKNNITPELDAILTLAEQGREQEGFDLWLTTYDGETMSTEEGLVGLRLAIEVQDSQAAFSLANEIKSNFPSNDDVLFEYARSCFNADSIQLGLTCLDSLNSRGWSNPKLHVLEVYSSWMAGENHRSLSRAIKKAETEITAYYNLTKDPEAFFLLARCQYIADNPSKFSTYANSYLGAGGNNAQSLNKLWEYSAYFGVTPQLLDSFKLKAEQFNILCERLSDYSIREHPKNVAFLVNAASDQWGNDKVALEFLNKAVDLAPTAPALREVRGALLYNLAYDCADTVDSDHRDYQACTDMALQAIGDLMFLADNEYDVSHTYSTLGLLNGWVLGNWESAVHFHRRACEASSYWKFSFHLARAYMELSDMESALFAVGDALDNYANSDADFELTEVAKLYLMEYYCHLHLRNFDDAVRSIETAYDFYDGRGQYDILEACIYSGEISFVLSESQRQFAISGDKNLQLLRAIGMALNEDIEQADELFQQVVSNPSDLTRLCIQSKVKRTFDYAAHFYWIREDYAKMEEVILFWNEWLATASTEPGIAANFYLLALSQYKQGKLYKAYASIEIAMLLAENLDWSQRDETFFEGLTTVQISSLRTQILSAL